MAGVSHTPLRVAHAAMRRAGRCPARRVKQRDKANSIAISVDLDHGRHDSGQDREFYKKDFVFLFILTTKSLFLVKTACNPKNDLDTRLL
ncbi:MAG: hypothetical protein QM296_06645 [Bacillota bacterium]|nr:hypothetical protein [Bacillota bacterium]